VEPLRVSFAIMAHPRRKHWVPDLKREIPDATVVWDEFENRWDTGRRSLLAFNADADWHVVVQDDALVPSGFVDIVEAAIQNVPGPGPIGLYFGRSRPRKFETAFLFSQAKKHGASWIRYPGPYWGVGIAVPTADIPAIVAYGDKRTDVLNYDLKIARYYQSQGKMCHYTLPSLVDHRTEGNPSLVPGRTGGNRRAYLYIGPEPGPLDWTGPEVNAEGKPI